MAYWRHTELFTWKNINYFVSCPCCAVLWEGGHLHSILIKVYLHPHGTGISIFLGCQQCLDHVGFSQHKGCTQVPVGFDCSGQQNIKFFFCWGYLVQASTIQANLCMEWNGIKKGQVLRSINTLNGWETPAHSLESVSFSHFVLRWVQGSPFRNICKWKWLLRLIKQWFEYVTLI